MEDNTEVLIAVLERLRAIDNQQREDATLLLTMVRAFSGQRPENAAQLDLWRQSAAATISQRPPADPQSLYDALIQQLKDAKDPPTDS